MNSTNKTDDSTVSYESFDSENESDGVIEDSFENSKHNIVSSSVENSFKNQSTLDGEIVEDSLLSNTNSVINYDNLNISETDNTKESIRFKRKKTTVIHSENDSSDNEAEENEISPLSDKTKDKNASFNVMQKNPLNYSDDSDSSDHEEQTKNDSSEEIEISPQSNKLKIEKLKWKNKYSDDSDSSDHEEKTKNDSSDENKSNESEKSMRKNRSEDVEVVPSDSDHEDDSNKPHKKSLQSNKKDGSFIDDSSGSEPNSSAQSNVSLGSDPDFHISPDSNKSGQSGKRNGKIIDVTSSSEDDEEPQIIIDDDADNSNLKTKRGSLKQLNLKSMIQTPILIKDESSITKYCTAAEYANQASKVADIRTNILRCKNTLRTTNLNILPDKGNMLRLRLVNEEKKMVTEEALLKNMVVETTEIQEKKPVTWEQLQTNAVSVVPRTFGKKAMETHTNQKSLTMDRLKSLHDSLAKCPGEDVFAEDPKGLKVDLMPHQKRALAWLVWREHQKPAGGILADDMGLGKTLTMISLVIQTKEDEKENNESDRDSDEDNATWLGRNKLVDGGTLVICPATLLEQWEGEVVKRCRKYLLSVEVHHGPKRETKANRLAKYDMIITTYKLAMVDFEKKGPLFRIKWKRIILDEAHVVRNHKSQTSLAVCGLMGKSRWALTGTPVHNKELDLYALLKFLRCSPFDDLGIWKHWVANKNAGGQERLNTVMTSILLRRTKEELQNNGALQGLPQKQYELINVALDSAEKQIYQKVLIFSRTLFAQFLHQRKEKDLDIAYKNIADDNLLKNIEIEEYNKMRKQILHASGGKEVKSNDILVLLLRLRQICCHPSLIVGMLNEDNNGDEDLDEEDAELDIVDRINKMKLNEPEPVQDLTNEDTGGIENKMANLNVNDPANEPENLSTAINKVLSLSNPVFAKDRSNEKIRIIQRIIKDKVIPAGEKIIIVSQWTSMLRIVFQHLKEDNIKCEVLDGSVPVHKRNDLVVNFNDPKHKIKVLLLSLTAGGVGLNLIGANHLLLLDLHWNPQLESQAQDRIYRVGQTKTVVIYKLVTTDTIEERIKALQDNKLAMASDILSGTRPGAGTKLSLDDLRMLFNV